MVVRNPQNEARIRINNRYDVRVLEPSPPAVNEGPWFADDPVAGGEVVPVEREGDGVRTWVGLLHRDRQRRAVDVVRVPVAGPPQARSPPGQVRVHPRRPPPGGRAPRRPPPAHGQRQDRPALHLPGLRDALLRRRPPGAGGGRRADRPQPAAQAHHPGRGGRVPGRRAGRGHRRLHPDHALRARRPPRHRLRRRPGPRRVVRLRHRGARAAPGGGVATTTPRRGCRSGPSTSTSPSTWAPRAAGPTSAGRRATPSTPSPTSTSARGTSGPREGDFWNEPFGASLSYSAIHRGADPLEFLRRGRVLTRS